MTPMTDSTSPTKNPRISGWIAVLLGLLLAATTVRAAEGPRDVVRRLADSVLAVLKDKSISSDEKRRRIEAIADVGVDFQVLSQLVLARNWSRFSPEEQAGFQREFKRHLSVTYGNSVDSYKNEDLVILSDREEGRGDITVKGKILRGGGADDILTDYRLRQKNGEWKIIDFIVEGVSLVANFRSQFQDLLASKTPAQVIALIHEKNARGETFEGVAPKAKGT